jgi:outer membrane receptor protein involved in Fe transport
MRKNHFLELVVFIILLTISFQPLHAQESQNEEGYLSLFYPQSELVSGATKRMESIRTAPATVRVFTKEEIRDLGAQTLSDLLNLLSPAVVTTQTNSRDSLWLRGVRNRYNDKVLLLVDSVPISDPVYSHSPIDEYLALDNVERVEIILGPASALYGSNAFAGTINVITKKPQDKPFCSFQLKGGDYSTKGAFGEFGFKKGGLGIYAYVSYLDTDGDGLDIETHNKSETLKWNPKQRIAGGVTLEYDDWILRLNRIHYYHTFYTDWDIPTWRWDKEGYHYNDTFLSLEKKFKLSERTNLSFKGFYSDYDSLNFWRSFLWGRQNPNSTPADVEFEIDANKNGSKTGGELQLEFVSSEKASTIAGVSLDKIRTGRVDDIWYDVHTGGTTRPFYIDPNSLNNFAGYFQQSYKPCDQIAILGGIRVDHLDLYGYKTTPRVNFVYTPTKQTVFKCLYGEAFRQPSFREYFTVDLTGEFPAGNTSLKPEKIRTLEASGSYLFNSAGELSLALFNEWTYDTIYSEKNLPYDNHEGQKIRGLEASYRLILVDKANINLAYSRNWCNLYNVPGYIVRAEAIFSISPKVRISANGGYIAKRPRDPDDLYYYDPTKVPFRRGPAGGYLVLNSTLTVYPVWKRLELSASVYNLLDKDYYYPTYEPTKYYDLKAPNRTFLIRLGYRF